MRNGLILCIIFGFVAFLFLQPLLASPVVDPSAHAPMEFLGMGPEMFADRSSAWIEALGVVCEKAIAKLGVIVLAALALRKTILSNAEIKDRLDRQADRINDVAIAAAPSSSPPVNHVP